MKNLKRAVILVSVLTAFSAVVGCSSTPYKSVDSELKLMQPVSNGTSIGVDSDKVVVLQKQTMARDELVRLEWQNNDLEWKFHRETYQLKDCRSDMADPRLGGNGELVKIPAVDGMKQTTEVKEEFGLVNGSLQFIQKEDFLKRIDAERKYQVTLEKMYVLTQDAREECERKMGVARRKVGLPSQRIQGISTVTAEGKIDKVIQKNENSLDDAFEIVKERAPASDTVVQESAIVPEQ